LARLASYIFHPLLMPTYLFFLLSVVFPVALEPVQRSSHFTFIVLIFIVTFLLPVLSLGILKTFGAIRSFELESRGERIVPFVSVTVLYLTVTIMFFYKTRIGFNDNVMKLMLIMDLLALMATLSTLFYKVSIHSLTAWGMVAILILMNKASEANTLFYPAIGAIALTGFIMSARVATGAHSLREVLWGGIAGLSTGIAGMVILFT
jgi:hypothetical protein